LLKLAGLAPSLHLTSPEATMHKSDPSSISLPVEVSGWDKCGDFFVEHTTLTCTETGEKSLPVKHLVDTRSVVFVRVLYADSYTHRLPEVYQVRKIESTQPGFSNLQLAEFPPCRSGQCEPNDLQKHPMGMCEEVKS
jgi:hypothetical protein